MKIDCHCHTIYSKHFFWGYDALNTPEQMIKAAMKKGLDGLAITDHDSVKGSLIAKKIAKKYKFTIITGSEISTKLGDFLALGIDEDIPKKLSLEETLEKIHELGGIGVAPHPFGRYLFRKCVKENSKEADAIEVFNSSLNFMQNKKALEFAKKYKKPITAGSDAHSVREVGNAGIICDDDPIESILKNKVKIFSKYTTFIEFANVISRKFIRSIKWRLSKTRGKYI
ncbi:MAG: PHP domain-containing protein [Candidatus Aenigmatarchaeota archaeon]